MKRLFKGLKLMILPILAGIILLGSGLTSQAEGAGEYEVDGKIYTVSKNGSNDVYTNKIATDNGSAISKDVALKIASQVFKKLSDGKYNTSQTLDYAWDDEKGQVSFIFTNLSKRVAVLTAYTDDAVISAGDYYISKVVASPNSGGTTGGESGGSTGGESGGSTGGESGGTTGGESGGTTGGESGGSTGGESGGSTDGESGGSTDGESGGSTGGESGGSTGGKTDGSNSGTTVTTGKDEKETTVKPQSYTKKVKTIILTSKVKVVKKNAFKGATALRVIKIKSKKITFKKGAFNGLKKSQRSKIKIYITKKMSKSNFKKLVKSLKNQGIKAKNIKRF